VSYVTITDPRHFLLVIDLRSSMSVLGAALPTWLSSWLTDASVRFGLPQRTSFRQEAR